MAYVDIATLQTIAAGQPLSAATVQQIRDNEEFLIDPPACSVYNSTTQSLTSAVVTTLTANSEFFDNDSMHSTSSNTSRITVQTAGRYLFIAATEFASNATGTRSTLFHKNATTDYNAMHVPAASGVTTNLIAVRAVVMAAGDYMEVRGFQSSGGALDITLREFAAYFLTR